MQTSQRVGSGLTGVLAIFLMAGPAAAQFRDQELESPSELSACLQKAAGHSEEAGTEILIATDGTTSSIAGSLSSGALRKMLSVVESPAPGEKDDESAVEKTSPGDLAARRAQDTLRYFQAIDSYRNDLKQDLRDSKSISQTKVWFDKYARKIEKLPILNVDPEMLDYGALVAKGLRAAAGSVTRMGINSGARQKQVQGSTAQPVNAACYSGCGWDRGGWGGYGYSLHGADGWANSTYAQLRAEAHQRQLIRSEEKAAMAMDVQGIKADLVEATRNIRRRMTERYQVEF